MHLDEKKLLKMEHWYQKHRAPAIILGRLVPGLRIATTVVAGIFEVPFWAFAGYTTISGVIWAAIYLTAGAVLGREYDHLSAYIISLLSRPLVRGALAIAALTFIGWFLFKRRPAWLWRDEDDDEPAAPPAEPKQAPSQQRR